MIECVIDKDDKVLEEFYQTPEYISSKSKLIDSTSSNIGMSFASYEEKEEFNNQLKAKKNADSEIEGLKIRLRKKEEDNLIGVSHGQNL